MQHGLLGNLRRSWWVLVVYGSISVLFAAFAFVKPFAVVTALTWAIGIMALAEGLISVFALFSREIAISRGWLAFYALTSIAFGLVTIINPLATAGILLMFVAAWLIIGGIFRIIVAVRIRKEVTGEWMIALSGVLAIVLGGLFFANPGAGLLTMMIWIGVLAMFYGILQIIVGFRLRRLVNPM